MMMIDEEWHGRGFKEQFLQQIEDWLKNSI